MENNITVPFNFKPRPYQLELFKAMDGVQGKPETRKRRAFLRWHRRAGKDKACWCYLLKEAATLPGNYFYIFPTAAEGRKALWENVDGDGFKTIDHLPAQMIKRKSNTEMLIELLNGSTIRIVGLDVSADKIRGVSARGCVFSEFAYQDPDAYKVLMPSLRETSGWAIFNSTPCGRNHFFEMETRVKRSPNWYFSALQTLWPDKENYSGCIELKSLQEVQLEEGFEDAEMEQEYGVSYEATFKGAIYQEELEKARLEGRIGSFLHDDHAWVDTFWDLGWNDYTSIWFRQIIGNKVIWIDYVEDRQKPLAYYIELLKEKGYKYRTHFLPHDGAQHSLQTGLSTTEMVRSLCEQAKINSDVMEVQRLSKQDGINAVRSRFGRFFFNADRCAEAIEMLGLYHRKWDKKRQILLKEPVHDWTSHCADAIRTEASAEEMSESEYNDAMNPKLISDYDVFED